MNNQLPNNIDDILASIYAPTNTDDPREKNHAPRTVNIYIDIQEEEAEQPPTVESTAHADDQQEPATTTTDEPNTPSASDQPRPATHQPEQQSSKPLRRPHPAVLLVLLVALVGSIAGITYAALMPSLTPSANITIVTQSQRITTSSTLQLVTNGTADPTRNQVPGRALPSLTMSQQKTVPTTGTTHQDAKAAHGLITFYNGATYTQTIPAGTALTGADGVQLVTDADAILPAAVFPTFGQASVTAHSAMVGTEGNVRAGDVYGACCRVNVSAVNSAFYGGQDARTYQSVSPQDIRNVATSVKTSLDQSVQAALQPQVQASETLITPLDCTQKVTPDHAPGEEATQVQVTVSETCIAMTYTTQAVTNLATQQATQDAERRLGEGYTTTGIQTSITHLYMTTHGTRKLDITSVSLWTHPFSQVQQDSMKASITGMSKNRATTTLLHVVGVQSVSITTKNTTTIPKDVQQIHILFVQL